MACNLARLCGLVALRVVKLCNSRLCSYLPAPGLRPNARVDAVALRKFFAVCMNRRALEDDFQVDEEAFAFGSFRLIPAQRMMLEDGKPLRLGSRALDILVTLVESAGETIHKGPANRPYLARYGGRRGGPAGSCRHAAQGAWRWSSR
jgi:hypothetical protein